MANANETSSPAHTPSPWQVRQNAETPLYVAAKARHGFVCVADIWGMEEQRDIDDEARANARLIAAAPDLLDMARSARNAFEERISCLQEEREAIDETDDEECCDDLEDQIGNYEYLLRKAEAAIAKATVPRIMIPVIPPGISENGMPYE